MREEGRIAASVLLLAAGDWQVDRVPCPSQILLSFPVSDSVQCVSSPGSRSVIFLALIYGD